LKKALSDDLEGAFVFLYISSGDVEVLGTIHNFQLIADITSLDIKKAGPFLTLLLSFYQKNSYG
jgi:hypothetical protein